mmetsp:Transcript_45901/g.127488  ORF Transcript_45901/g.127488 Transcript_45901/m.127488 type:complete len:219 (-) Transcript_45901:87-743(-)
MSSGVRPSLSRAERSAPASSSNLTEAGSPFSAATCSGVQALWRWRTLIASAEACSSTPTHAGLDDRHAQKSGVRPSSSMVLTGVPASQSSRTHSALPSSAAAASALAAIASLAAGERMETISASPRAQARQRMWPSSSRAPAATSFLAIHGSERSHAYESSTSSEPGVSSCASRGKLACSSVSIAWRDACTSVAVFGSATMAARAASALEASNCRPER